MRDSALWPLSSLCVTLLDADAHITGMTTSSEDHWIMSTSPEDHGRFVRLLLAIAGSGLAPGLFGQTSNTGTYCGAPPCRGVLLCILMTPDALQL